MMAKSICTEKCDVFALAGGMYVSALDIPWSQTNYPIKGFLIRTQKQIDELSKICNYVYVDQSRFAGLKKTTFSKKISNPVKSSTVNRSSRYKNQLTSQKITARRNSFASQQYSVTTSFKKELRVAAQIFQQSHQDVNTILSSNRQLSNKDVSSIKRFTLEIVASAIRNPDALTWLCRIQNADKKTYTGLISSAITGILFARHIGLTLDKIEILAQALLLRGIGLIKISKKDLISYRPGEKNAEYFKHIDLTLTALKDLGNCHSLVSNTIENYAERFDGNGYPAKKPGVRIPLLSQMMSIVSYYETSINPWVEARAISPAKAISNLFLESDKLFAKDLIEQFVQTIGIYPIGCIIKLSDDSTAVVIDQNADQRLRPLVAIIKDPTDKPLTSPQVVNLSQTDKTGSLMIRDGIADKNISLDIAILAKEILNRKPQNSAWFHPKNWRKLIA